jgi:hypothetical protein
LIKANQPQLSEQVDKLKERTLNAITTIALNSTDINNTIGNDYLSSQISVGDFLSTDEALQYGLSIINMTECLNILRQYYNLS